ncbi:hypothetical protein [Burkholderia ubonensis]|uniref:hypothetical protein n=1 Tax=Burkholderia ubonensis TaxID=101571 RepID=UPI000AFC0ED0|nr:hypothetical protein [Burkholderia ubonensis]
MGVRNYPDTPRVYFDFDGTLGDFIGAARAQGMEPSQFKRVAGAYRHLPLIAGAAEAIARVEALGLQPWGLTKIPASNPYSATEKLLWTMELIPSLHDKVIISPDKGAVGSARDFLVDDMPQWANAKNFPGTLIHFKGDWEPVFEIILSKLGRVELPTK